MAVQDTILEGSDANKVFSHNIDLLHKKTYEMCGSLVAWSLLHGGLGLPVLNTQLFELIIGGEIQDVDINCKGDPSIRDRLLQVIV